MGARASAVRAISLIHASHRHVARELGSRACKTMIEVESCEPCCPLLLCCPACIVAARRTLPAIWNPACCLGYDILRICDDRNIAHAGGLRLKEGNLRRHHLVRATVKMADVCVDQHRKCELSALAVACGSQT